MKQTSTTGILRMPLRLLSLLLCVVLIAAMALTTIGCDTDKNGGEATATTTETIGESETTDPSAPIEKGTGATAFTFVVTLADGATTTYTIHTDKDTVGAALLELELIAGEDSTYGLYVKTVQGVTADYDTDKTYWAFYINGEYAMTGVDQTKIEAGATYTFKIEKG